MINRFIRYFDLQSNTRTVGATGHNGGVVHAPVLPQYLVVSAGVIIEPLLRGYLATDQWPALDGALIGRVVFGLVIGIIILPGVYKAAFDPQKPILIQLAALFPLGIGWQSLFTSATTIALG